MAGWASEMDLKLDSAGIKELLTSSEVRSAIDGIAADIRNTVEASLPEGTDVVADSYTTDRAAASVTIRDVAGKLWQVRDGVLTRAAASAGLEVKAR